MLRCLAHMPLLALPCSDGLFVLIFIAGDPYTLDVSSRLLVWVFLYLNKFLGFLLGRLASAAGFRLCRTFYLNNRGGFSRLFCNRFRLRCRFSSIKCFADSHVNSCFGAGQALSCTGSEHAIGYRCTRALGPVHNSSSAPTPRTTSTSRRWRLCYRSRIFNISFCRTFCFFARILFSFCFRLSLNADSWFG